MSTQPSNAGRSARQEPEAWDVPSPCINICRMNEAAGVCEGCFRTIGEIANWSVMSASEKKMVLARINERRVD
ncbi:MAG: DUF1289 domain-containing protein [Burkholderiales bacterium]